MKKTLSIILAVILVVAMSTAACAEWKFERKIDLVCGYGVGGGMDSTLRPMATLLQDILGVPVEIVNVEGGNGVNGIEYTYKQPADGYTFMGGSQSLFIQDMMGVTSMDYRTEFEPIDMLVYSINFIVGSKTKMEQYGITCWSELQEYVAAHPYEISVAMLSSGGVDGASLAQATEGLDLLEIAYASGSDANSALVGGHCDLYVCGYDEIAGLVASGDIIPLLALSEKRLSVLPDLECSGELGINSFMAPWRAVWAVKGTPKEAEEALAAAIEEARQTEAWQNYCKDGAYDERSIPTIEELPAFVAQEYKDLRDYMAEQGTLVKDYEDLK